MARPEKFELPTTRFEASSSVDVGFKQISHTADGWLGMPMWKFAQTDGNSLQKVLAR